MQRCQHAGVLDIVPVAPDCALLDAQIDHGTVHRRVGAQRDLMWACFLAVRTLFFLFRHHFGHEEEKG